MVAYSIGSYAAQIPLGERKSGMPLSVEIPAPVSTTHGCDSRISSARCSADMPEFYAKSIVVLCALLLAWPAGAQAPRRVGAAGVTVALPAGWHATRPEQG